MPALACPRCQRANPEDAVFCYYDGAEVRPVAGVERRSANQLPHEFVFPSGRRCYTYEEFVQGCQYEWEDARELLHDGVFEHFMASLGRLDLARTAREAQAQQDADIGLYEFMSGLPNADRVQGPRLDLDPRRLFLGKLKTGDTRQVPLTVKNEGKGLLRGTLTIHDGDSWLLLAEGGGRCPLMTAREQRITLLVNTTGLSGPRSYSAELTVITNGGIVEVPVGLEVTAFPFPKAPFQGAASPREIAERMRTHAKPAAALLESGEVARWFEANGWTFPVDGPQARGVAAVQQFFESMGLSRPPLVVLSEQEVYFTCLPQEVIRSQVTIATAAKKWVYAHVESDVPWLRVTTPTVSGPQQAGIGFEVDAGLMDAGQMHTGCLRMTVNGGETLAVRVRVHVHRPHEPFTRRLLRPWLTGGLLAALDWLLRQTAAWYCHRAKREVLHEATWRS